MITRPAVHAPSTTVAQLRRFFRDDHVHIALLADRGRLIGTVERADLTPALSSTTSADAIARLHGRTISANANLAKTLDVMKRDHRRRLAVISDDSILLGLLCLKASGLGFCSDADVGSRRSASQSAR